MGPEAPRLIRVSPVLEPRVMYVALPAPVPSPILIDLVIPQPEYV